MIDRERFLTCVALLLCGALAVWLARTVQPESPEPGSYAAPTSRAKTGHVIKPEARQLGRPRSGLCFDVGFNTGQDIHALMDIMQCRLIVSVEASATLVERGKQVFASEIRNGSLVLVQSFLHEKSSRRTSANPTQAEFFWSKWNTQFNSFSRSTGCRAHPKRIPPPAGAGYAVSDSACKRELVNITSCRSLYYKYGVPMMLRLDIEGQEMSCVHDLHHQVARPDMLSMEFAQVFDQHGARMIHALQSLGYRSFKRVNAMHGPSFRVHPDKLQNCETQSVEWVPLHRVTMQVSHGGCKRWSDLYARLAPADV
mmetsp:Transcript_24709/g.79429  ORF Transcript_24709/g.79429 Transcript_24709/m.79429 type:complete len:312 (-) Transcript_24709:162-1097(-)